MNTKQAEQERKEQEQRQAALKILAAQLKALADHQDKAIEAIGK